MEGLGTSLGEIWEIDYNMKLQGNGLGLSVKCKNLLGSCSPILLLMKMWLVQIMDVLWIHIALPVLQSIQCAWMKFMDLGTVEGIVLEWWLLKTSLRF